MANTMNVTSDYAGWPETPGYAKGYQEKSTSHERGTTSKHEYNMGEAHEFVCRTNNGLQDIRWVKGQWRRNSPMRSTMS